MTNRLQFALVVGLTSRAFDSMLRHHDGKSRRTVAEQQELNRLNSQLSRAKLTKDKRLVRDIEAKMRGITDFTYWAGP